jgi:AraC family transcriptional regulator
LSEAGLRTDSTRAEYERRVNRVIDHVRGHLDEALTLAKLARVAAFSPFHFHRVFSALTGETLFAYIQRQRIEKAAGVLAAGVEPTILEVALDHGFSSAATFARAFRAHFGMSATEWHRPEPSEIVFELSLERVMHTRWEHPLTPQMRPVHRSWRASRSG